VKDSSLTYDQFFYHHPDARTSSIKEWHETKTGVMACHNCGCVALTRIDKTIQDPVWEAAKSKQQTDNVSNNDPTGQLPNQPHIEFFNSEFYLPAPHYQDAG
jgi:hypothetical protein